MTSARAILVPVLVLLLTGCDKPQEAEVTKSDEKDEPPPTNIKVDLPLKDAYAYAAKVMVDNMMARDAEEGISAFRDKRKPEWKGS